jgi:hypothetical protein
LVGKREEKRPLGRPRRRWVDRDENTVSRDSPALKMEAICSSETSVLTTTTRHQIPEDDFLHIHHRENLKSYTILKWILERSGGFVWIGLIWLRIGTSGGLL